MVKNNNGAVSQLKQNYRPKEAAEYLGVSLATVWNYIGDNKLQARKISSRVTIIPLDSLEALINGGKA